MSLRKMRELDVEEAISNMGKNGTVENYDHEKANSFNNFFVT